MNAVEMRGISKNFGTVQALSNVDFTLRQGEIHAVLGENGAGKTTLMKILYGMHKPSSGEIFLKGNPVTLRDSQAAIRAGIGMVHQHFMLIPVLSVAENIVAGREPRRGVFFDFEQAVREVEQLEQRSGFQVDPRAKVETLSVGQMDGDGTYRFALLNDSRAIQRLSASSIDVLMGLTQEQLLTAPDTEEDT